MRNYHVVSVIGPDRPGIVKEVSRIAAELGCNIEDSRMAVLGGDFALMMLLSAEGRAAEEAAAGIRRWAERGGMTAADRATHGPARPAGATADIGLEMPDRPGIVSRVTRFLAERGANVETLETDVRPAPFTGTPQFAMRIAIRSAGKIELERLRAALPDLASAEDIHITIGTSA